MPHAQTIHSHTFENGLTLVAQPMGWLESAAFSIAVPAGCRYDPADQRGLANLACEMVLRGSGELSNRQFVEALEYNGVDYSSSAAVYNTNFGGAMLASRLFDTLALFATMLQRPALSADQFEDGRQVCIMEAVSLEDDLAQRTVLELRSRLYGDPDGRASEGSIESLQKIRLDDVHKFYEANYRPNGMILAVAGKFEWDALREHVGDLLAGWAAKPETQVAPTPATGGTSHIKFPSEQTHIAVGYPAVAFASDEYFLNRGAVGVLSDGLSSRLFTEVREKRGLCYTVSASCHSLLDRGSVISYSGTTADRAQETLNVLIEQLTALGDGIRPDELERLKIQIRSGLIMQQESCRARASAIAGDWMHLGRVRTLDEISEKVNALSVESINQYLANHPPSDFVVVTLGPEPLEYHRDAVSATSTG